MTTRPVEMSGDSRDQSEHHSCFAEPKGAVEKSGVRG